MKQQNLEELKKITLINILSAKGIIYTHYKNKQLTKENKNVKQIRGLATNG
jgi:cell division protein FtsL